MFQLSFQYLIILTFFELNIKSATTKPDNHTGGVSRTKIEIEDEELFKKS